MKVLRQWLLTTLLFTAFTAAADLAAINREAQSLCGRAEYARALPLYRQLAEQGDSDAMRQIGFMYKEGKGVPKDFAMAKSWYEKAIAAGYNRGRINGHWLIGVLYEEGGPGLERDFIAAQRCYEKAIAVGDGEVDDKIIVVPADDRSNGNAIRSLADLPEALLRQIEFHFNHYKDLKKPGSTKVERFGDRDEALQVIIAAQKRWVDEA